ncbi:hypothetical protein [Salmonirosea aquatica]|uniref:Uncharacterized protein n=1 Tax=Salmonirosea aquatica TaxID=2654236 RepID=A0A7C9FTQ9_9BACT|nr:hypothetical protein [Cytophagaceae bacterium SJW1-29]
MRKLNIGISEKVLAEAVQEIPKAGRTLSLFEANREITSLLRDGTSTNAKGDYTKERVRYVDFNKPGLIISAWCSSSPSGAKLPVGPT